MPASPEQDAGALFLGVDMGTSGIRACACTKEGQIAANVAIPLAAPQSSGKTVQQHPALWWQGLQTLFAKLSQRIELARVACISIDGTSGTVVYCDPQGEPLHEALMYNDRRSDAEARQIAHVAPKTSGAHGAHSGLAKYLWLKARYGDNGRILNQADWLVYKFSGHLGSSDENNCLKLGYDVLERCWPAWLSELDIDSGHLPEVVAPGTAITSLQRETLGLKAGTLIRAGTTDSIAATLAAGVTQTGEAVTSLGSTLAVKIIADKPVFAPQFGVYSHRLGDTWLCGGASNSGGRVLRHFFNDAEMAAMTPRLHPDTLLNLGYYPLIEQGERFPVYDPQLTPKLTPRPQNNIDFFQALLEGIADIEERAYHCLHELGAPYPNRIYSSGGGARNSQWQKIRETKLGVPCSSATQQDAAYGAALIAAQAIPLLSKKETP